MSQRVNKRKTLTRALIDEGLVTEDQLLKAMETKRETGKSLARTLIEMNIVSESRLTEAMAHHLGLEYVDLNTYRVDVTAVSLMEEKMATNLLAIPIAFEGGDIIKVAMSDPTNIYAFDDIKMYTGYKVKPVASTKHHILAAIRRYYREVDESLVAEIESIGDLDDETLTDELEAAMDDTPIVKFVNYTLLEGVTMGASDIHFDPQEREMALRYRVDGVLHDAKSLPRSIGPGLTSRIKIMSDLNIAERRVPQDGHYSRRIKGKHVDFRVAVLPTVFGEKVVLRILDKSSTLMRLSDLGFHPKVLEKYETAFRRPNGAILVTGPTGSGKSTTLYATLNVLNTDAKNITTVEDPVEYRLDGINQMQINPKAGLSFANALRSILRTSPDIIMVGEMRDLETAQIGVEAALTGHLVFSTLHTNDAPSAITRLTEMGIKPFLTASGIECILAQRLTRQLCACKQSYEPERELLGRIDFPFEEGQDITFYRPLPGGCELCGGTGYKGRIAVVELMMMTPEIEQLTIEEAPSSQIRKVALEQGMWTMKQDGWSKVKDGITSIEEVLRVVV